MARQFTAEWFEGIIKLHHQATVDGLLVPCPTKASLAWAQWSLMVLKLLDAMEEDSERTTDNPHGG